MEQIEEHFKKLKVYESHILDAQKQYDILNTQCQELQTKINQMSNIPTRFRRNRRYIYI